MASGDKTRVVDLSVSDVAHELRIRREHVVSLLKSGALKGYDVTPPGAKRNTYRITRAALEDFKAGRSVAQKQVTPKQRKHAPRDLIKYF